uniref:Uncharacterized protein n=1 Tax=Strongyloides papillosus TaxID=174720 RepID=A0A0N5BIU0_STREA
MIFFNRIKQYILFIFCILIIEFVKFSLSSESEKLPEKDRKNSETKRHSQLGVKLRKNSKKEGQTPKSREKRLEGLRKQLNVGDHAPISRPLSEIRVPERKTKSRNSQHNSNKLRRRPSQTKDNQNLHGQRRHSNPITGQLTLPRQNKQGSQPFRRSKSCRGYFCFG